MMLTQEEITIRIALSDLREKEDKKCSSSYAKLYTKFLHTSTKDAKEKHE